MLSSLYFLPLITSTALASYSIVDDYEPNNFANKFNFFTGNDPTNGYVNYIDQNTAQSSGLYGIQNNQLYVGVDHSNTASGRGRNSVRLESKATYQHGLIILDLAHMPGSVCGTWPAFWLLGTGATWPGAGEIDIIEGVNSQRRNLMAGHTNAGCSISNTGGMSGDILTPNCDVNAPNQATNQGCAIDSQNDNSYGDGFNAGGGGVYATEWTSDGFSIWYFPRSAIPANIQSGSPDTSAWGLPMARFEGACDWDSKFRNQQIIFDITFCGDWAGGVFSTDAACSSRGNSCQAFVQNNPHAFEQSYWLINSLKVYQENGRTPSSTSTSTTAAATSTPTFPPTTTAATTLSTVFSTTAAATTTTATTFPPVFTTPSSTYPYTQPTATWTSNPWTATTWPNTFETYTRTTYWPETSAAAAPQPTGDNSGNRWGGWGPGNKQWGPPS